MRVSENQVFNLMDTNGRRNDVIYALQGYLEILDDVLNVKRMKWKSLPESLAQLEFYKQAIEFSPDVFKKHDKFDKVMEMVEQHPMLKAAIQRNNIEWIQKNYAQYQDILAEFDLGAEDRARHYTSNLVKLGLVDDSRTISEVGNLLLGKRTLHKDELETLLPLNDINIIYLRQLLKLRVYSSEGAVYYAPFCMAIFTLLKKGRVSQDEFCEIIQGLSPYRRLEDLDSFVEQYEVGAIVDSYEEAIPEEIHVNRILENSVFEKYFKNRKSASAVKIYYEFYLAFYKFCESKKQEDLNQLLDIYETEKTKLNTAFGYGRNIFGTKRGERPEVAVFLEHEQDSFEPTDFNVRLFRRFFKSKKLDVIREYSDTTVRIFKATGLISFDNGYVELSNRDLCDCIFELDQVRQQVFGHVEELYSQYGQVQSMIEILKYSSLEVIEIIKSIQAEFGGVEVNEISQMVEERRKRGFAEFIERNYPEERVVQLLQLFSDRKNDGRIKKEVSTDASVPTIFEYIVGLAWYYFSDKRIDLLQSFNLTMSADFEPLTHAGGGMGDIVIGEEKQVIMLEATLMNANSQKRGEWEPVLRHSVNLKIEEEEKGTNREVTTFFIADSFDSNTINIWKAISSVPMESSVMKGKFTDNVIIMPISTNELIGLVGKKAEYDSVIQKIRALFVKDETTFDLGWRNKFINELL